MSRGLGVSQRLFLQALAVLEAEDAKRCAAEPDTFGTHRPGCYFYVWAIVEKAYALSDRLQGMERDRVAASEADEARMMERAKAGDKLAREWIVLGRSLGGYRSRFGRMKRRKSPQWITEEAVNPSRVLASLERRGLVAREPLKGGGSAALTGAGANMIRHLEAAGS